MTTGPSPAAPCLPADVAARAFDGLAVDYDASFTDTPLGRRYRAAVWRRLDAVFQPGQRVLELNCGTGEDARHLAGRGVEVLATDVSAAMVDAAAAKNAAEPLVTVRRLAIEEVAKELAGQSFDGVVSNFGGLNCVADLADVASALARLVRPGGTAVLCIMGPLVPWEWVWQLGRGRPAAAFRRLRPEPCWRGLPLTYPSVGTLRDAFAEEWLVTRTAGLGALLPPPDADVLARRLPRLVGALDRLERRIETAAPIVRLADHYLAELRRR